MPTVVGLDLSLTSTGICIDGVAESLTSTHVGVKRLADIGSQVCERVFALDDPAVCVEGYSFGSRNSQAHAIGELGGVVRLLLWEYQVPVVEIPPTCRAKFATGRGNAGKDEVVSAISARTGIVWAGRGANDRCDAWILEEMGRVHFGTQRHDWPQVNLSALEKVDFSAFTPD